MVSFLKACGKGLLYIIACPILILIVCLSAVIGLVIFLFLIGKSIVLFFNGRTIFSDLPEDIEAKKILQGNINNQEPINNDDNASNNQNIDLGPLTVYPSDSNMYNSDYSGLTDTKKEETPVQEVNEENNNEQNTQVEIKEEKQVVEEKKDEEIIEVFKPLSSRDEDD